MILIKYILKNHSLPFISATFILIAVFLLQFLMKVADKLIGKGLGTWVIIKLIGLSLGYILVLVIPMAVLVATLMAFGNMSQNNEVTILKSTGISLYKMIIPPLAASVIIAIGLVYFNNNIYPDANHELRILQEDITRKKPTLSIVPGVFSQEVANYSILVREIDQTNNNLKQITIYDYSNPPKVNIVTADEGKIYFTPTQKKLMMDLKNGEIHESDINAQDVYRKLRFVHHKIAMPAEQFTFEQSAPGGPRGDREIGAPQMQLIVDSLRNIQQNYFNEFKEKIRNTISTASSPIFSEEGSSTYIHAKVEQRLRSNQATMSDVLSRMEYNRKEINRYLVEIHKKYALPAACIVFVLIGAPLGTMTRKGGIGMAAGISLFFFIVYWAFLIGGEKLADRDLLSPFIGIWSANFVLGIFGLIVLIKTAREKITLSFDFVTKYIPKSWKMQEENENT